MEFAIRVLLGEGVVVEVLLAHIVDVGHHIVELVADGLLQFRDFGRRRRLTGCAVGGLARTIRAQPNHDFDLVIPIALGLGDLGLSKHGSADEQE